MKYNPSKIEKKWQVAWEKNGTFKDYSRKEKFYALDMFPYPSGEGLHVGHPKGYIATDVSARFQQLRGKSVLHPMGWDAFGLPAENYALKNKIHPAEAVAKNIKRFKEQLQMVGCTYDWNREINTTDPEYYRWTQWIFLKMFEKGLAYESYEPINWCPSCKTGLANEDLEDGKCERCGSEIEQKPMRQWLLKMTEYADRLLADLDTEDLDWEKSIVDQQKNWIGRSEGTEVRFNLQPTTHNLQPVTVFTTRVDTIFGCTYVVIAPEYSQISTLKSQILNWEEVEIYIEQAKKKTTLQRTDLAKEKTGVKLEGVLAINPFTGEAVPVFVADYVLGSYGTGAVMAVPAHDERDFEFAKNEDLSVKCVVSPIDKVTGELMRLVGEVPAEDPQKIIEEIHSGKRCYEWKGRLINSGEFSGLYDDEAREKMTEWLEKTGNGKRRVNYKMRDWVFSRQRYWGEPIPVVHCEKCGTEGVPEKELPVALPDVVSYEPTGTGESPLAGIESWVHTTCPKCGGPAKRETNTMPQWAGSSWYYLAYIAKEDPKFQVSNCKIYDKWLPVDLYVGGAEHATRHLLYARFWHKFLYDIGVVPTKEPFKKLVHVGLIGATDGRKMSKRWNNVINPDDVIAEFGADSLRLYEMFMGPFIQAIAWNTEGVSGVRRFLEKVWRLSEKVTKQKDEEISGAGVFIEIEKGKFLFHIRDNNTTINPGRIGFFGGGRELGETVRQCVVRELQEELEIHTEESDFKWIVDLFGPKKGWDSFFLLPFECAEKWRNREWNVSEGEGVTVLSIEEAFKNEKLDERTRVLLEFMQEQKAVEALLHKTIKKVTEDIEEFRFNTAISSLMILVNRMEKSISLSSSHFSLLILLLSPFAPHIAEELWEKMGHATSIFLEKWPEWNEKLIVDEAITLVIQVNGKVRDTLFVPADIAEEEAKKLALASEKVQKFIDGKEIRKMIFVKGKLVNVVV